MKRMLFILINLFFINMVNSAPTYPENWRTVLPSESGNKETTYFKSKKYAFSMSADYNGDGIMDFSSVLINDSREIYSVYAFVSKNNKYETHVLGNRFPKNEVEFVRLMLDAKKPNCFFAIDSVAISTHCWNNKINEFETEIEH